MSDLNMIQSDNLLQASGCCGGGACSTTPADAAASGTTTTYVVNGMTCGHCVQAVTQELESIDGVSSVTVELGTDGPSTVQVTSAQPLDAAAVRAAIDEAGYSLAE